MTTADDLAVRRVLEAAGVEFVDANGGGRVERVAGATSAQPDWNAESQNGFGDSPDTRQPNRSIPSLDIKTSPPLCFDVCGRPCHSMRTWRQCLSACVEAVMPASNS
jgi:hypothetical protein